MSGAACRMISISRASSGDSGAGVGLDAAHRRAEGAGDLQPGIGLRQPLHQRLGDARLAAEEEVAKPRFPPRRGRPPPSGRRRARGRSAIRTRAAGRPRSAACRPAPRGSPARAKRAARDFPQRQHEAVHVAHEHRLRRPRPAPAGDGVDRPGHIHQAHRHAETRSVPRSTASRVATSIALIGVSLARARPGTSEVFAQPVLRAEWVAPAEGAELADVEQLARRAVGLGEVDARSRPSKPTTSADQRAPARGW